MQAGRICRKKCRKISGGKLDKDKEGGKLDKDEEGGKREKRLGIEPGKQLGSINGTNGTVLPGPELATQITQMITQSWPIIRKYIDTVSYTHLPLPTNREV